MIRLHLDWIAVGSVQSTGTLHYSGDSGAIAELAATAVAGFWDQVKEHFSASTSLQVREQADLVDPITGTVTDTFNIVTERVAGTGSTPPVPQAAQVLLRLLTGARYAGRTVRGRLYLPGFAMGSMGNGEVGTAAQNAITAAGEFLDPTGEPDLLVYTRPKPVEFGPDAPGRTTEVNTYDCWNEFAILRSRRS